MSPGQRYVLIGGYVMLNGGQAAVFRCVETCSLAHLFKKHQSQLYSKQIWIQMFWHDASLIALCIRTCLFVLLLFLVCV